MLVVLAPLIAASVIGAAALLLQYQRRRQHELVGRRVDIAAASAMTEPSILYFTGENCSVCHVAQRPALLSLPQRLGRTVTIREVDVADDPALTRRYRVLTLPTTIVLRSDNSVSAINAGFAPADTLHRQLLDAGLRLAEPAGAAAV